MPRYKIKFENAQEATERIVEMSVERGWRLTEIIQERNSLKPFLLNCLIKENMNMILNISKTNFESFSIPSGMAGTHYFCIQCSMVFTNIFDLFLYWKREI
ncbi:hypothetical protein CS542_07985 [Pedobacter sp. IW39]|nr:hypothetical protein CS542_07985 [Pedobacter sp. IW39]